MSFTMVKKQWFIIHLICVITISTSAKSIGDVKEFNINSLTEKENAKEHHDSTKDILEQAKTGNIKNKESLEKEENKENSNIQTVDSMYTESDLEEVSKDLDAHATKDRETNSNNKETGLDDEQLLDIYTESDLDETKSQDEVKRKDDKKSASSYLYVPHRAKRNAVGFQGENEDGSGDGSGEGSGDNPTAI
ncbi:lipase-like isoform X3 [Mercenaria mercenaria]|uniref:lipase-like isoform X3 n=1 Tax=Mercenaria mercenaria TaxID=6596 RepID=UPI001E1D7238|nr:lipase-like isoform X3 [Mercenaria mercenaria]